jgi:hypothetical protein
MSEIQIQTESCPMPEVQTQTEISDVEVTQIIEQVKRWILLLGHFCSCVVESPPVCIGQPISAQNPDVTESNDENGEDTSDGEVDLK